MADFLLSVGIDVGLSYEQMQKDITSIVTQLNANPPKITFGLELDAKKIGEIQRQIGNINLNINAAKPSTTALDANAIHQIAEATKVANTRFLLMNKRISAVTTSFSEMKKATGTSEMISQLSNIVAVLQEIQTHSASITTTYKNLTQSLGGVSATGQNAADIEAIKQKYIEYAAAVERLRMTKATATQEDVEGVYRIQAELQNLMATIQQRIDLEAEMAAATESATGATDRQSNSINSENAVLSKAYTLLKQLRDAEEKWTAAKNGRSSQAYSTIQNDVIVLDTLIQRYNSGAASIDDLANALPGLTTRLKSSADTIRLNGENTKTWTERVGALSAKFSTWFGITNIIMYAYRSIRKMVTAVIELDTAMTELKKVTNETDVVYDRFLKNATSRAKELGSSLSDVVTATADFARLGFDIDDASKLADAAIIYKNVGDGIEDISAASESIIATMQAFDVHADDVMSIVDKFNEVGNSYAISSVGIGEALLRSAAAMEAANNTLDETIALTTAANTIVQNPDTVGTTLKTVSMYLRAAKTEAEEAGESTDGMAESVSELRGEILRLTGQQVDIQIDEDTFKSTYQILKELSMVWKDLSDVSQANILEMVGGKRNSNVVSALLENFTIAEKALQTSAYSAGSALAENEKHLESIQGRIEIMKATFETLANNLIGSDVVKVVVNIATALLNLLNLLSKLRLLLPAIVSTLLVFKGMGLVRTLSESSAKVATLTASLISQKTATDALSAAVAGLTLKEKQRLAANIQAAVVNKQITAAEAQQILTTLGLATAEGTLTVANKTLGASFKSLMASIPVWGWIALAITVVIEAVTALTSAFVKNRQEAIDSANEIIDAYDNAKQTYASNSKTLADMRDEFNKLSAGVDENGNNVSLTASQYETFLSLIEQIVDISPDVCLGYDNEGKAILNYKSALDDAISSQEAYMKNQRNIYLGQGEDIFDGKATEYEDARNKLHEAAGANDLSDKSLDDALNPGFWETLFDADKAQTKLDAYKNAFKELGIVWRTGVDTWRSSTESVMQMYEKADELMVLLRNSGAYTEAELSKIETRLHGLAGAYTQMASIEQEQINYLTEWSKDQDWYANIPRAALDEFIIGLADVNEPLKSYNENIQAASQYGSDFYAAISSDASKGIIELSNGLKDGSVTIEEYNTAVDNFKSSFSGSEIVLSSLIQFFNSLTNSANQAETSVNQVSQAAKSLNEYRRIIRHLIDANNEYNESGSVSTDMYNDIIALSEDYADIFDFSTGKITINNDALKKHVDGLIDQYGAILAANGASEDQIAVLASFASALNKTSTEVEVTTSTLKNLVDVYMDAADGTELSTLETLDLIEQYPDLIDAITQTETGYKLEADAVKTLVAEKAKLLKINESLAKQAARENFVENAGNSKSADTVDAIFEDYYSRTGQQIETFDDYVSAWEQYFDQSASGNWINGLEEYVDASIDEIKRLALIDTLLADMFDGNTERWDSSEDDNKRDDKKESAFEKEYKRRQHLLAMEQESVDSYLEWLVSAHEAAYQAGQIDLDEYYDYQEEVYEKTKELFSDYLNDSEHDIFMLENADAEASEIVSIYSTMIAAIDRQIETYLAQGLDKNSDYIQELREQRQGYVDDILSTYDEALNVDLSDYEHDIFMLEQHKGSSEEITAIYRKMQEAVHATAEEYRALGLAENDDYIQELQKQWWEYEESIAEIRKDDFDDYLNDKQFSIEQLKANGANASEISRAYSEVLKSVNAEIEYYTSRGFDITDEIIQDLVDELHSLEDEVISSLDSIVSEAQSAVDDLQNVYTTLGDAADEYAEYGYITVDSLQSIIDLGVEYMAFLQDENGQLVINKENIQNVIAARTEQLAVESALNYVEQLRLALESSNTAELERLLSATNNATNATWGLVYANLALLNLEDSQYAAALNNINNLRSLADNAIANIGASMSGTTQSRSEMLQAELDARKDALKEQQDALDEILDYTMDLVKWEAEQQIEALEEQISDYEEIVDLKKEMLEATKEEADYEDSLSDKIEEIAKIQERINALSLDDSRDAQAERIKLEEELADLQEELGDYQADHMLETHENTLDDMADAYRTEKEDEIAAVEASVSSTEKVYQLAIDRINNDWEGLYQDLLAYNYEYGNTLQQDLVSAWNAASMAVQEYGSYVQAVSSITAALNAAENTTITPATGTTNLGNAGNYMADASAGQATARQVTRLVDRMKANSAAWWSTPENERQIIEDENVKLAAQIEALIGEKLVRGEDGVWYLGSVGSSRKLYDYYHDGGYVGVTPSIKQNETLAVLENDELVLTKDHQTSLMKLIDFASAISDKFGKLFDTAGYKQVVQTQNATTAEDIVPISEDKRISVDFGDVYITGANDDTVEKHREVNRQFVNDVLKQLNIKR